MNYKPRLLAVRLQQMVECFPVVVVCGARQVGKSTRVSHALSGWDAVVFDPAQDTGNALQDPDLFLDNHPAPLVLDEIQYAPELVAAIKRRIDRHRLSGQYVLTGLQQWAVLCSASESLAGRPVFLELEGFGLAEITECSSPNSWLARYLQDPKAFAAQPVTRLSLARTTYQQLWLGCLPECDSLEQEWVGAFHRAYLQIY